MANESSDCHVPFGHGDFDLAGFDPLSPGYCPIRGCSTELIQVPYNKRNMSWCPEHGVRLHLGTFVYWNGQGLEDEARLRNFIVRPDLVRAIALPKGMKAESHRLGYEMSEDALSWNVFVSLAEAGKLRDATQFLTGRNLRAEPQLYLWGRRIDAKHGEHPPYEPLLRVRMALEPDIQLQVTPRPKKGKSPPRGLAWWRATSATVPVRPQWHPRWQAKCRGTWSNPGHSPRSHFG